jgi:muramoyltetrapeptide carboxypeptidase
MNAPQSPAGPRVPPLLRPGDRVALFSPSSHQGRYPPEYLADAAAALGAWGLDVLAQPEPPRHLYLAGTDAQRAEQFRRLYLDPAVKALFCTRGGYGSARLLPLLDRATFAAAPPKWVVGFSDVTSLFAWLHAAGVCAVHGPCLAAPGAVASPRKADNLAALRGLLFGTERPRYPAAALHLPPGAPPAVEGRLLGGCLSVLVSTLGTPWAPDTRGAVLFLEDTDEAPYRMDRMLTHLRAAGALEGVRAVAFGYLQRCDGDPPGLLHEVLADRFRDAPFPVVRGLTCGHGDLNLPLLLGAPARLELDGDAALLTQG